MFTLYIFGCAANIITAITGAYRYVLLKFGHFVHFADEEITLKVIFKSWDSKWECVNCYYGG